jgi:cyanophycinase
MLFKRFKFITPKIPYIHSMKKTLTLCIAYLLFLHVPSTAQSTSSSAKGKLFIIGGGDRTRALMETLIATAAMKPDDYAVVLPMSSEEPDTSFFYFKEDYDPVCKNALVCFNFTKKDVNNKNWLDSLQHARLIFITGGDQERFMNIVRNTPVYTAIHAAYTNGATVGGTSAGAALMSEHMITGNQLTDTSYSATFRVVHTNNIEIKEGLGLLTSAIIDQHFIKRSRYNRLLSAIAKYPTLPCIGIDEATAIIVQGDKVKVTGESQVIVLQHPEQIEVTSKGLIKLKDLQFTIYTEGDEFLIGK